MEESSWRAFYESDLQSVYALLVVPALFLAFAATAGRRAARAGREARFVWRYSLIFSLETLIDPVLTGPFGKALDSDVTRALMLLFVLLGDFRVFLLVFALADPRLRVARALGLAAAASLVVPIAAWTLDAGLRSLQPGTSPQLLWLVYELCFTLLALALRSALARRPDAGRPLRFLRAALLYVAGYYALWAASDALIVFAGLDAGWLLRALPNQLYYALWVPAVFFGYFALADGRAEARTGVSPRDPDPA